MATTPRTGRDEIRSIALFTPQIRGNEWKYVKECLDTAWVSSVGSYVSRFEKMLAERAEVEHAVAVASGTAALHTALRISGVEPEDEVLVSTLTFIASANAIRYCGAWPVFIDAEPRYWQMDPQLVAEFLENRCVWRDGRLVNHGTGRRVRAIMPVHVLGHPVDMTPILDLARRFELLVIEDAAEGLGVKHHNRPVGGLGHVGCLSFNGNKLITTGGGGALLTNDAQLARRARYLTTQAKNDPLEYVHHEIGYNYRLTNLQAAVGCGQLECLDEFIATKQAAAQAYRDGLKEIPGVSVFTPSPDATCTFWMNTIRISPTEFGCDSRQLLR
ncbi:MAG: aminotransferase class I/II-fold pyridoxal phosphate-dependent enzyme, partial [Planctomycetes bacterium]|nr:aminotransferase class I/II-fold pyridoxal phosphate-dependent enzyme [Planctomycetota bacterium]